MPSVFKYNGNEIIDSSGKVTATAMNSSGDAPVYGCRAWVNFDGTKDTSGATSTANTNRLIRASGNVASVLRNGTGDYTITFTTAMPDANYSFTCGGIGKSSTNIITFVMNDPGTAPTTNSLRIRTGSTTAFEDRSIINVAIFR